MIDITDFIRITLLENKPYYITYKWLGGIEIEFKTRDVKNTLDFFNANLDKKKFDLQVTLELSIANLAGCLVRIGDVNYEKMTWEQRYKEICAFNSEKYKLVIEKLKEFEEEIQKGYEETKKL